MANHCTAEEEWGGGGLITLLAFEQIWAQLTDVSRFGDYF